ncbi:MAG TPA: hypothetical protein VFP76_00970 [Gemmatimonadota bacterium]|nr:hypothetical protein [Gemmatimonadota bacterium]
MKPHSAFLSSLFAGLVGCVLLLFADRAEAQIMERLGNAARHEAEAEANRQVRRGVRAAIRCAIHDHVCQNRARKEGRDVILVDERGNPVDAGGPGTTTWHLTYDGRSWKGDAGRVIDDGILFALHLIDDEVSFFLFLSEADEGEHRAEAVVLAFEEAGRCSHPFAGSAPFTLWLDEVDKDWVAGAYEGPVLCEEGSAPLPTRGTFRVAR